MKVNNELRQNIIIESDGIKAAQLKKLKPIERKVLNLAVHGKSISKDKEAVLNSLISRLNEIKGPESHTKSSTLEKIQKKLGIIISSDKLEKSIAKAPMKRLWKNGMKAIEEHQAKGPSQPFTSLKKGLPSLDALANDKPMKHPLKVVCDVAEDIGVRPTMEDAHFFKEIPQGVIAGVFDGHAGSQVSNYANEQFSNRFSDQLVKNKGNVAHAFQSLIDEIHNEVVERKWDDGATAVICFIVGDNSGIIYTATLGDSEANIYRKMDKKMKSIPLSCLRDWTSKKDAKRAAIATDDPSKATKWPKAKNPKALRFPTEFGINVSRAIGDVAFSEGISHKAKITVNQVKPGDKIVIACDGLKDYVPEKDIVRIVDNHLTYGEGDLAKKLMRHALNSGQSMDNVTVLVLDVG